MAASAAPDAAVDVIVRRMVDRLRPCMGGLSEEELARLAAELFVEGARFALDWVEG